MIALSDSQWIDLAPFVGALVALVIAVNVALILGSVWCAYRPRKPRTVARWEIERRCGKYVDRQDLA